MIAWQPASHASWANWAVVQAREEVLGKIDEWLANPKAAASAEEAVRSAAQATSNSPRLRRNKSGELIDMTNGAQVDEEEAEGEEESPFDYLLYSLERMDMFRKEFSALGL